MEKTERGKRETLQKCGQALCDYARSVKVWADKYLLHLFAILAAVSVFVVGIFMCFKFKPMEEMQAKVTSDSVADGNVEDLLMAAFSSMSYEQTMFNPIGALFVGFDAEQNREEYDKLSEQVLTITAKTTLEYKDELLRLYALMDAKEGTPEEIAAAVEESARIIQSILDSAASSMSGINLIKLDRLDAEIAYSNLQDSDPAVMKVADDSIIRTVALCAGTAAYVYLQVIALVLVFRTAVRVLQNKNAGLKLYGAYLIGFAFLLFVCEVCGVTLNGAGIACFVLMAIFGGLSWLYRLFTSETSPVLAAAKTVVAALTFSAFCIFFCAMYDFGVSVDRIGAVFGLYGYDGALPEGRTAAEILLVNLLSIGVPHLVCMGLILASLLKALGAGAKGKVSGWILPLLSSVCVLLTFILLSVFAGNGLDIIRVSTAMLVMSALCLLSLAFASLEQYISFVERSAQKKGETQEKGEEQGVPAQA